MGEEKQMELNEFKDVCRDMLPHMEAIRDLLQKKGIEATANIMVSASGYMDMYLHYDGWRMSKTDDKHEAEVTRTFRYRM